MSEEEPNAHQTLAVLLGASLFRRAPKLAQGRAFHNSAADFQEYLLDPTGLNLPQENVIWLFDDSRSPSDQLQDLANFLESRSNELKISGMPPQDLIAYYVGHGLFSGGPDQTYYLATRATDERSTGLTSIRVSDLALIIKANARFLRKVLILDCCFSSAAYREFQSGPLQASRIKLLDEFPKRGTTLLCSASAQDPSLAPVGHSRTMFTDSLLRALRHGHPSLGPRLSLSELGDLVKVELKEAYPDTWVRPEVHSPDQREGDVANVPLFPNAYVAKQAEEARLKAETERARVETATQGWAEAIPQPEEEKRRARMDRQRLRKSSTGRARRPSPVSRPDRTSITTTIYFATNRVAQGPIADWHSYGADIVSPTDPSPVTYATAFVEGIDLAVEGSGVITAISHAQPGWFQGGLSQDIVGSGKNILIFIHGFANSFLNAITRAAFNREWFAASGVSAADTTVIAFTWPSLGQLIAAPPHLRPDDYLRDQSRATQSGFHIASFFANLQPTLEQIRSQGRRVFLLAHSMGNFALQAAVESWFANGKPASLLFDEVFLAAADERHDSFAMPMGVRLSRLGDLSPRISIYHSNRDVLLFFSFSVNLMPLLGREGPIHKTDALRYPPRRFRILDCAEVNDYDLFAPPDASHQYYRRSPKVRADITAAMQNNPGGPGGPIRL